MNLTFRQVRINKSNIIYGKILLRIWVNTLQKNIYCRTLNAYLEASENMHQKYALLCPWTLVEPGSNKKKFSVNVKIAKFITTMLLRR